MQKNANNAKKNAKNAKKMPKMPKNSKNAKKMLKMPKMPKNCNKCQKKIKNLTTKLQIWAITEKRGIFFLDPGFVFWLLVIFFVELNVQIIRKNKQLPVLIFFS
jgi:hypothetical protein